ncbi:hypothetical protein BGZ47_009224 [Haplosporangium gracile]|nr:hypothetical protein BGZ47_009224 [Haplosporangium gracile]
MSRLFIWLSTIVLVTIAYIALLSGIYSAQVPCTPNLADPYNGYDCRIATLQWVSTKSTWYFFTRKYKHYIYFNHFPQYAARMTYESRGFENHCHEDGNLCVNHGDPQSPEVAIWFKGYTYQHNERSKSCLNENGNDCSEYFDYITPN